MDRILTTSGKEINFQYIKKSLVYFSNKTLSYDYQFNTSTKACGVVKAFKDNLFSTVSTPKLSKITFDNGELIFKEGNARCDLKGDNTLSSIELWNKMGNGEVKLIKQFTFTYGYHNSTSIGADESCLATDTYWTSVANLEESELHPSVSKRLVLKSIQESGSGLTKPPYEFSYYDSFDAVNRFTKSVDYAGFYNGVNSVGKNAYENQIRGVEVSYVTPASFTTIRSSCDITDGVDKTPSLLNGRFLTLHRIKQPSGLIQDFSYELNRAFSKSYDRDISVPGLRIRSIRSTIPPTGVVQTKDYSYDNASGESSGRLTGNSDRTYQGYTVFGQSLLYGEGLVEFPMTQGNSVGYSEVSETENGPDGKQIKTTVKFYSPLDFPDIISSYYPFGPPRQNNEWKRGLIKEKTVFKYSSVSSLCGNGTTSKFCPVSTTKFDYTFYDESNQNANVKGFTAIKVGFPAYKGPAGDGFFSVICPPGATTGCTPINTSKYFSGYYEMKKKTEIIYK